MNTPIGVLCSLHIFVAMVTCLHHPHRRNAEGNSTTFIPTTPTLLESCAYQSNNSSCKTLPQILCQESRSYRNVFGTISLPIYPFFVHPELYYDHDDFDRTQSSTALNTQHRNCEVLVDILNHQVNPKGACSWSYTCTYIPDEFPAFRIEAGACTKNGRIRGNAWECEDVFQRVKVVKRENQCWKFRDPRTLKLGCQLVYNDQE